MSFEFNIPSHHKSIIKVIGVGGGGSNAVNYMNSSFAFIPRLAFKTHSSETQSVLLWKLRF